MFTKYGLSWLLVGTSVFIVNIPSSIAAASSSSKPNIIYFLVDDLGYSNVGFNNDEPLTPNINALHAHGIEIASLYTFHSCSPSRSSLLSGRIPSHVNQQNHPVHFPGGGIPLGMTTIADKLKGVGYATHQIGKWHAGMSGYDRLPISRGFDSSFGYLGGNEDHYSQTTRGKVDFWRSDGPATTENGTGYGNDLFTKEMTNIIDAHDVSDPLFIYMAYQNVHWPLQAPQQYIDLYPNISNKNSNDRRRKLCLAMVSAVDWSIGVVVGQLETREMFDNTLLIFSSDNGATGHGNNFPFRGMKGSDFEGGVRAVAFIAGGVLPQSQRGTKRHGLMHLCDWYATLASLAGYSPDDPKAAENNLPAPDSINMWPWLMGETSKKKSPRSEILLASEKSATETSALIMTINGTVYKWMRGQMGSGKHLPGPRMPNNSEVLHAVSEFYHVIDCIPGCFFDLTSDPYEHNDLITSTNTKHATALVVLKAKYQQYLLSDYQSDGVYDIDSAATTAAVLRGGFWGPWLANGTADHKKWDPAIHSLSSAPDCVCQDTWFYNEKHCHTNGHLISGLKQMNGCPSKDLLAACNESEVSQSWCATTEPICKQQSTAHLYNTSRSYCDTTTQKAELPKCTCRSRWSMDDALCEDTSIIINGCASVKNMKTCYGDAYNEDEHQSWCRTEESSCLEQEDIIDVNTGKTIEPKMVGEGWAYCDPIEGHATPPLTPVYFEEEDPLMALLVSSTFAIVFVLSALVLALLTVYKRRQKKKARAMNYKYAKLAGNVDSASDMMDYSNTSNNNIKNSNTDNDNSDSGNDNDNDHTANDDSNVTPSNLVFEATMATETQAYLM